MGEGFVAAGECIFHHSIREWSPSFCGRRQGVAAKPPQVTVSCFSGTTKGLCDRPLETFARPLPVIGRYPTLAGRGGSVSRRDHNQATGNRTHLAWAHKSGEKLKSIPSHSSGEGVWGRGASLREAASPPESPPPLSSLHLRFADGRNGDGCGSHGAELGGTGGRGGAGRQNVVD